MKILKNTKIIIMISVLSLLSIPTFSQTKLNPNDFRWAKGTPQSQKKPKNQMWYVQVKKNCGFTIGYGKNKTRSFILACSGDIQDARKCYEDYKKNISKKAAAPVKKVNSYHLRCHWKGKPEVLEQNGNKDCQIGVGMAICGTGVLEKEIDLSHSKKIPLSQKELLEGVKTKSDSSESMLPPQQIEIPTPKGTIETIIACQPDQIGNPNNCFSDSSIKFTDPKKKAKPTRRRKRKRNSDAGSAF